MNFFATGYLQLFEFGQTLEGIFVDVIYVVLI